MGKESRVNNNNWTKTASAASKDQPLIRDTFFGFKEILINDRSTLYSSTSPYFSYFLTPRSYIHSCEHSEWHSDGHINGGCRAFRPARKAHFDLCYSLPHSARDSLFTCSMLTRYIDTGVVWTSAYSVSLEYFIWTC